MKELMSRFVLLEHTGHPDDPTGKHFDLLLEQADACETWRLADIPRVEQPAVVAAQLPDASARLGLIDWKERFPAVEGLHAEWIVVRMSI